MPRTIRTIVLTGFMGAGKSTIGARLAKALGWDFVDVDKIIEAREGKSIAEIFAEQGEPAFRTMEAEAIREQLGREGLVLSLGGGAIETQATRDLLFEHESACLVFLDAPLEVLVGRCLEQPDAAERPVLADREGLQRRFNARLPYYRQAHLTIPTSDVRPEQVVANILNEIQIDSRIGEITRGAMAE